MIQKQTMFDRIHGLFSEGNYLDGIELLEKLPKKDFHLIPRVYLLYRPLIYNSMKLWAERILDCCELFFPKDLIYSEIPNLYYAVVQFEEKYEKEIRRAINENPEHFEKSPYSEIMIKQALSLTERDKECRRSLHYNDDEHLIEAQEIIVDMVKQALLAKGEKLKDYSVCDLIRRSREAFHKNLVMLDRVNKILDLRNEPLL